MPTRERIQTLDRANIDPATKRRLLAHARAATLHEHLTVSLPFTHAGCTIETARLDRHLVILTGRGVLDDPDTDDDSWTWHIGNPPLLVGDRFVPLDALRQIIETMR